MNLSSDLKPINTSDIERLKKSDDHIVVEKVYLTPSQLRAAYDNTHRRFKEAASSSTEERSISDLREYIAITYEESQMLMFGYPFLFTNATMIQPSVDTDLIYKLIDNVQRCSKSTTDGALQERNNQAITQFYDRKQETSDDDGGKASSATNTLTGNENSKGSQ